MERYLVVINCVASVSRADLDRRPQPRTVRTRARRVPHDARARRAPDRNVDEESPKVEKVADSGSNLAPGQSRALYAILTPGSYVFICNLPGHYRLGMHAALVVQ